MCCYNKNRHEKIEKNEYDDYIILDFARESKDIKQNFEDNMGDTGLLVSQMMKNNRETGTDLYKALIFDKLGSNQGMIVENVVAQM